MSLVVCGDVLYQVVQGEGEDPIVQGGRPWLRVSRPEVPVRVFRIKITNDDGVMGYGEGRGEAHGLSGLMFLWVPVEIENGDS